MDRDLLDELHKLEERTAYLEGELNYWRSEAQKLINEKLTHSVDRLEQQVNKLVGE